MQVHPQISQFITLVLISPNFKPSHPSNLSSTSITFYTQHFRSINESLSLCPQFEQQFFFFGIMQWWIHVDWNNNNNSKLELKHQQQQKETTKRHWQNRLDLNIKEKATMTRSWLDRVNSFTTRLSHRRYTHRSHTEHRRFFSLNTPSSSLSQPNLRRQTAAAVTIFTAAVIDEKGRKGGKLRFQN